MDISEVFKSGEAGKIVKLPDNYSKDEIKTTLQADDYSAVKWLFASGNKEAIEAGIEVAKEASIDMKAALQAGDYSAIKWSFASGNKEGIKAGVKVAKEVGIGEEELKTLAKKYAVDISEILKDINKAASEKSWQERVPARVGFPYTDPDGRGKGGPGLPYS